MTSTQYTFDNKSKYLQANVKTSDSTTAFTISSSGKKGKRAEYTTVETSSGKKGVIQWKRREEVIQFDGTDYKVEQARKGETGLGSLWSRRWNIAGRYLRTFYDMPHKTWNVYIIENETPQETPIVTFHEHEFKRLKNHHEPATLIVESSVSEDDLLLILLIILCSHYTQSENISPGVGDSIATGTIIAIGTGLLGAFR